MMIYFYFLYVEFRFVFLDISKCWIYVYCVQVLILFDKLMVEKGIKYQKYGIVVIFSLYEFLIINVDNVILFFIYCSIKKMF